MATFFIQRHVHKVTIYKCMSDLKAVLSIQVVFGGDPEAALIQYTKNEEARRAISSIEAVLNNRFIRVHWHREPGANSTGLQQQVQSSGNQAAGLAPGQGPQHSNLHKVIQREETHVLLSVYQIPYILLKAFFCLFLRLQGIKQHNPAAYVLNNTVSKPRLSAPAGTTATTKPDSLNPNTDVGIVRCSLHVCHVMPDLFLKPIFINTPSGIKTVEDTWCF